MAQNILKSKTGKLGMIVVIILIFIVGLLWFNGNPKHGGEQEGPQAISVPEKHETVTMKIPKSEPEVPVAEAVPAMEEMPPAQYENQAPADSEMDMESPETPAEMLDSADVPEVSILEQEKQMEAPVPIEPEISFDKTANDQAPLAPAADDQTEPPVAVSNVPEPEPVAAPPQQAVAKKTTVSPKIRKKENTDGTTGVDQQHAMPASVLQDIRISENMKGKILEIWANGTIENFKYFILSNPPRLVIDLPGKWEEPKFHIKAVENDLISQIRLWRHASKLRIVSDLKSDRTLKPVVTPNPDGVEFLLITE